MALITLDHITKVYPRSTRPALDDISLSIERGEFVFLVGASGSGKTTLLSLLIAEEDATDGEIRVAGNDLRRIPNRQIPRYRRSIGFVFQDYKLLENKTVWQNVAFALEVLGHSRSTIRSLVPQALKTVGLTGKEDRYPQELSGGEAQRVAIARAYVNHPQIILADEPTGNLDPTTSVGIMEVLEAVNRTGTTIVMATHNEEIVNSMRKRVIELHEGVIVRDEKSGSYDSSVYYPDADVESAALTANGRTAIRMAGEADADEANTVPNVAATPAVDGSGALAALAAGADGGSPDAAAPGSSAVSSSTGPSGSGAAGADPSLRRFMPSAGGQSPDSSMTPGFVAGSVSPDGQSEGIARLVRSVHSGRTGRYGEAFAPVEETLTWGKGLRLDEHRTDGDGQGDGSSARHAAPAAGSPVDSTESTGTGSATDAAAVASAPDSAVAAAVAPAAHDHSAGSAMDASASAGSDAADGPLNPPAPPQPPLPPAPSIDHTSTDHDHGHHDRSNATGTTIAGWAAAVGGDPIDPFAGKASGRAGMADQTVLTDPDGQPDPSDRTVLTDRTVKADQEELADRTVMSDQTDQATPAAWTTPAAPGDAHPAGEASNDHTGGDR